jgi:predicted transcriptional regulator
MEDLLRDRINLLLLQNLCSGEGLDVNLTYLSRRLKRHRNTVRKRIKNLLSHKIIDRPVMPFLGLFKGCPLLVVAYADLPQDKTTVNWIKEDPHIFGAFRVREGAYNMMLFEFHRDVGSYHVWREPLVRKGKIPARRERTPSEPLYFSNRLIVKYEPNAGIDLIEEKFRREGEIELNGYLLDDLAVKVLKHLVNGEGIKVNENFLSKRVGIHRATVRKRNLRMQREELVLRPLCRFPLFFVPPGLLLVFSMLEVKKLQGKLMQDLMKDPHVSLMYRVSAGKYNVSLFNCHWSIEDYLEWESKYEDKYPGCFGSIKNNYLSPQMTISIDQQKASMRIIQKKLRQLNAQTAH